MTLTRLKMFSCTLAIVKEAAPSSSSRCDMDNLP